MSELEKIERYIQNTKIKGMRDNYDLSTKEVFAMKLLCANRPIEALYMAFQFGRVKGYRAANKEATV